MQGVLAELEAELWERRAREEALTRLYNSVGGDLDKVPRALRNEPVSISDSFVCDTGLFLAGIIRPSRRPDGTLGAASPGAAKKRPVSKTKEPCVRHKRARDSLEETC